MVWLGGVRLDIVQRAMGVLGTQYALPLAATGCILIGLFVVRASGHRYGKEEQLKAVGHGGDSKGLLPYLGGILGFGSGGAFLNAPSILKFMIDR